MSILHETPHCRQAQTNCLHTFRSQTVRSAVQVYDSLNKSEAVPPEKLAYFDDPEGALMLYHIRFLPASARPRLAVYIVDQQLSAQVLLDHPS